MLDNRKEFQAINSSKAPFRGLGAGNKKRASP